MAEQYISNYPACRQFGNHAPVGGALTPTSDQDPGKGVDFDYWLLENNAFGGKRFCGPEVIWYGTRFRQKLTGERVLYCPTTSELSESPFLSHGF